MILLCFFPVVGVIPTSGLPDGVFVLSDLVFIRGPDGDGWRLVACAGRLLYFWYAWSTSLLLLFGGYYFLCFYIDI